MGIRLAGITAMLLLGMCATSLHAQSPCYAENDGPTYTDNTSMGGPNLLLGIKFTPNVTMSCTAIEVFTGETTGTNTISIWTHDAANNRPLAPLGTGSWSMSSINSWQGASLPTPIPVTAGTTYWLVWGPQNNSQASLQSGTTLGQVYRGSFDGGQNWNGPWQFKSDHWKFRLYCPNPCSGFFQTYGTGCPNSLSKIASLTGSGCPTPSGTMTVDMQGAIGNSFAMIFIGSGAGAAFLTAGCQIQILPLYPPAVPFLIPPTGALSLPATLPATLPAPIDVYVQTFHVDAPVAGGVAATNALQVHIQ